MTDDWAAVINEAKPLVESVQQREVSKVNAGRAREEGSLLYWYSLGKALLDGMNRLSSELGIEITSPNLSPEFFKATETHFDESAVDISAKITESVSHAAKVSFDNSVGVIRWDGWPQVLQITPEGSRWDGFPQVLQVSSDGLSASLEAEQLTPEQLAKRVLVSLLPKRDESAA